MIKPYTIGAFQHHSNLRNDTTTEPALLHKCIVITALQFWENSSEIISRQIFS